MIHGEDESIREDLEKAYDALLRIEDHFDYPKDIEKAFDWIQEALVGKKTWICKGSGYWEEPK